jgi:hypothetical protein
VLLDGELIASKGDASLTEIQDGGWPEPDSVVAAIGQRAG